MQKENVKKSWTTWDICSIALILFIGFLVSKSGGFPWEKSVLQFTTSFPDVIIKIMKVFTLIGDPMGYVVLWIPLIVFVASKNKRMALFLALAILLPAFFETVIKLLVQRNRPFNFMLIEQGGFSYPSGHSATGLSAYFMLGQFLSPIWKKRLIQSIGVIIGISRLFLGVHWPTDVLMGFILGYIIYKQLRSQYVKN